MGNAISNAISNVISNTLSNALSNALTNALNNTHRGADSISEHKIVMSTLRLHLKKGNSFIKPIFLGRGSGPSPLDPSVP